MNICMFTNTYLPHVGGVARSVSVFTEDLQRLGHRVLVVAPVFKGWEREERADEEVLRVPAIQNFNGSDFSVRLPLPYLIDDRVSVFKPDLIHSHHPFLLGDAALRTARGYQLPLVFTHHTRYEQYTHYVPFDSQTMKRFVINLVTEYANLCDAVIAPSRSIAALLKERGIERPVYEVPTGIDTAFFAAGDGSRLRRKYNIADDILIIGHLGRLAKEKNLPYLAAAVSRFLQGRRRACFLVAGQGDAEDEIRRIFAAAGQQNQLLMDGILTGSDLADAYQAMDLFVFASQSETQGLVLAEAMAAATPVVALNAPGVQEVMQDGVNGFQLRANASVQTFANAIERYAAMSRQQQRQLRAGAMRTAAAFAREPCARRLLALYELAINRHAAAGSSKEGGQLETLLNRLEAEWELLVEKVDAVVETITGNNDGASI